MLKVEYHTNITNYTVPGGLSMSRIIYVTEDSFGRNQPASAYILWPYHALPANDTAGYDAVLWAHGTAGHWQPCAPSSYRSLQYHFMVPYTIANQGIAVVAPDYAGLGVGSYPNGTKFRHAWATAPAGANDMAFALVAARSAFPDSLKSQGSYVAMGHSEGGRMAWGYSERQAMKPSTGYRGTVSLMIFEGTRLEDADQFRKVLIAPAASPIGIIQDALNHPNESWALAGLSLSTLTIDAVDAVYPSYTRSGLSNVAAPLWQAYEDAQACLATSNVIFGTTPPTEYAKPGWFNAPEVLAWDNLTTVGNKRFAGPMLIQTGDNVQPGDMGGSDGIIPFDAPVPSSLVSITDRLCNLMAESDWDQSLQVVGYKAAYHFALINAGQTMWMDWIKQRLNAAYPRPPSGCSLGTVKALDDGMYSVHGISPPSLVEKVLNETQDSWQYIF